MGVSVLSCGDKQDCGGGRWRHGRMLKFGVTQTQGACFEAASKSLHDLIGRMCLMLWLTLLSSANEQ